MTTATALDPHIFGPGQPCFGCSPEHPIGLRLTFSRIGEEIVTKLTPGDRYQGPPGIMHGGLVTTLADELAVWTVLGLKERMTFTAAIQARLARPVRIGVEVEGRGRITSDKGRVIEVGVTLAQEGVTCFTGQFTLALLDERGAARVLGGPLPEAWRKFAR
ncbi:thioesterase superfamily protein [Minicystis rosea]|nr:thioesterase superfamily protein [Minicystis rosea]